jgi:hypothetical protein
MGRRRKDSDVRGWGVIVRQLRRIPAQFWPASGEKRDWSFRFLAVVGGFVVPAIFASTLPYTIGDVRPSVAAATGGGVHGTLSVTSSECSTGLRAGRVCDPVGDFLSDDGHVSFADARLDAAHAGGIPRGTTYRVTWQGEADHEVYGENSPESLILVLLFLALGLLSLMWCFFCGVEVARRIAQHRRSVPSDPAP